jgi:hypothetical protein
MEPNFMHKPIPGISLTGEPGAAPWERPPQYTTIDEVIDYYSDKLVEEEVLPSLIDSIKRDIPLLTIADGLMKIGVMQGMHSIDAAMLAKPVVVELMIALAEIYGVKYVISADDMKTQQVMPTDVVNRVVTESVTKMAESKQENGGLIARRKK